MKISYINSVCVRHDAISAALRIEIGWIRETKRHDVKLFAYACDFDDVHFCKVDNVADIVFDPHFQSSDLVIFHFGVFYPLFDMLPIVPISAKRVVVFHNITPKQFVSKVNHETIDQSFRQMTNMVLADRVICDSQTNLDVLRDSDILVPAVVLPLAMDISDRWTQIKPSSRDGLVRIAFIGRFVRSKGPLDLLAAIALLAERSETMECHLDMVGNVEFSDPTTLQEVRSAIEELHQAYGGRVKISLHGSAAEEVKRQILSDADFFVLPTYHEGFCVPILEALAHNCQVITYDNSNLPSISGSLAMLVPTGNIERLSEAIEIGVTDLLHRPRGAEAARADRIRKERVDAHLQQFSLESVRKRFLRLIDTTVRRSTPRVLLPSS